MSTLLGIDIGGTAVKIGVVDENGKVLLSETRSVSFDGYKTSIMTTVANLAGEVLEKSPVKIEGIGVSATGQIDVNSGTVIGVGAQLGDWLGSPVKKILEDRFHLPVTVINDANAAALGEQTFGRAKGKENVLVVTVGTGIGGGIAVASAASAAIGAMSENEKIMGKTLIFVALAEGIALYGLVISIMIIS